jgi:hypothetical protein
MALVRSASASDIRDAINNPQSCPVSNVISVDVPGKPKQIPIEFIHSLHV